MDYFSFKPDLRTRCILEILTVKRLLVDHLEVAEICLRLTPGISERLTTTKVPLKTICAFFLASVAASTRILPGYATGRWQIMVTAIGSSLVGAFLYEKLFYYRDLRTITSLIRSIEQYDTAAKRILIFVNEVIYGNERISLVRHSENELLVTCVESFTKANYELYDYANALEERTRLREEYSEAYDPPESFADCEVFKQATANHSQAKQLYNIFLYMQSHCLLRLALAIASDTKVAEIRKETDDLAARLARLAANLSKQLQINSVSQVDFLRKLSRVNNSAAKEHSSVKQQSLELTVKLAANVYHMLDLDKTLQSIGTTRSEYDRQQLEYAAAQLTTFHSYLLTRTDECEHLLITVKKLLNVAPEQEATVTPGEENLDSMPPPDTLGEPLNGPQSKALEWQDEFFVNTGAEGDEELNGSVFVLDQFEAEDELLAKRMMRKQFQPILRQLRQRLVPVELSFKERERAAMERKGILLPEAEEQQDVEVERMRKVLAIGEMDDESSDSEGSMDSLKLKRSQARYDDDREFLASKAQFSLLAATLTKAVQMEESILE